MEREETNKEAPSSCKKMNGGRLIGLLIAVFLLLLCCALGHFTSISARAVEENQQNAPGLRGDNAQPDQPARKTPQPKGAAPKAPGPKTPGPETPEPKDAGQIQAAQAAPPAASALEPATPPAASGPQPSMVEFRQLPDWRTIDNGLEILEVSLKKHERSSSAVIVLGSPAPGERAELVVVRSNPARCVYSLYMASEDGRSLSVRDRLIRHNLDAAINAGMYLPDNLTNTGFMRNAAHVNNGRLASRYGSFFLAGPRREGLPEARLLERAELGSSLESVIADYDIVIQNFRLIGRDRSVLWPESLTEHSISALADDNAGNILLILCRRPLSAPDFARSILSLPLNISTAMYLEGGVQSGLALLDRKGGAKLPVAWWGTHNGFMNFASLEGVPLPNVLGVSLK